MTPLSQFLKRIPARTAAGLFVGGVVLAVGGLPAITGISPLGGAVARAAVATPSFWKVTVTPDDEARQADRDEFVEYLTFDSLGFSAEGLAKLGFPPTAFTTDPANANVFSVNLASDAH